MLESLFAATFVHRFYGSSHQAIISTLLCLELELLGGKCKVLVTQRLGLFNCHFNISPWAKLPAIGQSIQGQGEQIL